MVGTLEPRKNHARMIRAFEGLPERFSDLRLVLAGGWGWRCRPIREAIQASPARARIRVLGTVPDADLMALYQLARVFAFPSLYEGFGIPLLEAMAAGTPILTSNVASMPEVAGDAALCVDPRSVDALRSGLERLLEDEPLRARLTQAGQRRERDFDWTRTAQQTLETYRCAIAAGARLPGRVTP
jgi:alpha-1,3-rhamnosyl/mannosyltransferase